MKRLFVFISVTLLLSACGISRRAAYPPGSSSSNPPQAFAVSSYNEAQVSLKQAYRDWKGTPYVLGGRSVSGVDCSSFVGIVFDDYFGIDLPMNTRAQLNQGHGVRRVSLRTGDLVFFRTGRKTLHVGIIVEEGNFLHASTSVGVTISSIYDNYWSKRFLGARRVM